MCGIVVEVGVFGGLGYGLVFCCFGSGVEVC